MLPQSIPVDAKMSRYVVLSDTKCHRAFDNGPSLSASRVCQAVRRWQSLAHDERPRVEYDDAIPF
jgi:hypothetical protein